MYGFLTHRRAASLLFGFILAASSAAAQSSAQEGSGTASQPQSSDMRALHVSTGEWMWMVHFSAFAQYIHDSGDRGASQFGSINWFMASARRSLAGGSLNARGMISAEPITIAGCGYPDLLATGESCDGAAIHDRQHPHDLVMEAALEYDRPLARGLRLQLYGGPAGEPALGPAAFMHRPSGELNPLAPITHHWMDSTHITYGVATVGVLGARWKIEASAFNGREPDEDRVGIDLAPLDSWSTRAWWLPSPHWALQVSTGRLNDAERDHDGAAIDVRRTTASLMYHRSLPANKKWVNTIAWGRNAENGTDATNAVIMESTVSRGDRDAMYGRLESVAKTAHDLSIPGHGVFNVVKAQGGYTRFLAQSSKVVFGVGLAASASIVPRDLVAVYGGRVIPGINIYATLTPRAQ
jgi:hypothetical protein